MTPATVAVSQVHVLESKALKQFIIESVYHAFSSAYQLLWTKANEPVKTQAALTPGMIEGAAEANLESIAKARRAIAAVWNETLELAQREPASPIPLHRNYTAFVLEHIEREAKQHDIALRDLVTALTPLFMNVTFKQVLAALRELAPQRWVTGQFFILARQLIAMVRLKTQRRHGVGVLSLRPHTIPLTVQPCAP